MPPIPKIKNRYPSGKWQPHMSWEEKGDIMVPRLDYCPTRISYNQVVEEMGWSEADEEKIAKIKKAIAKEKAKPLATREGAEDAKALRIAEWQESLDDLREKRKPLTDFENKIIRACRDGSGPLAGPHFFYYHFGNIESIERGSNKIIQPDYRQVDNLVFRHLELAVNQSRGLVAVKRRRIGMTWAMACFVLYTMLFKDGSVFFSTHSETDIRKFVARVKLIMELLPDFLKPGEIVSDNISSISFKPSKRIAEALGKDLDSLPVVSINTAPPTSLAKFEGQGKALFVVDEAGLTPNLDLIITNGESMLNGKDGISREGAMIIFGTVGEMHASGGVFHRIWKSHKSRKVNRLFLKASYGSKMDHAGNDLEEIASEQIKEQIKLYEDDGDLQAAARYRQLFPMDEKDAFTSVNINHPWPSAQIQMAEDNLDYYEKHVHYGLFKRNPQSGEVEFMRQEPRLPPRGHPGQDTWFGYNQVAILEHPIKSDFLNAYAAGIDPAPYQNLSGQSTAKKHTGHSDITLCIVKRVQEIGGYTDFPVCIYHGRPDRFSEAYFQWMMALEYYDNCMVNIERNKGGSDVYQFFEANNRLHLLAHGTGLASKFSPDKSWGFSNSVRWKENMMKAGERWWVGYQDNPVPVIRRFVEESWAIGRGENTDLMIAWLAAMQLSTEFDAREGGNGPKRKHDIKSTYKSNPFVMGPDGRPVHRAASRKILRR